MTTYTHDNGVIVGGTDSPAEIAIWNALADGPGDRQYIHPPQAAAIHAAYLHSLGLALFEHDAQVAINTAWNLMPPDTPRLLRERCKQIEGDIIDAADILTEIREALGVES